MTKEKRKYIPKAVNNIEQWKLTRRRFLGISLMAGSLTGLPSISLLGKINIDKVLSVDQIAIVCSVQNILFPSDSNGPGAHDVMADKYLIWVLSDKRMDPEEKEYIINGIGWVDESAIESFSKKYAQLSQDESESLIADISKENWGSSWLSVMLTFIFEALLCDPQYRGNPDSIGWEWLKHNPGYPRPDEQLLYPEILSTISTNNK